MRYSDLQACVGRVRHVLMTCLFSAVLTQPALGQVSADSIPAWTQALQSGSLVERMNAVSKLSTFESTALPGSTQSALVAELRRLNDALVEGQSVLGEEQLVGEDLGEYQIALSVVVAGLDPDVTWRALVGSIGISSGIQRRVARQGDDAVRELDHLIERGYGVGAALRTMGYAWFWADSAGAQLSTGSREIVLQRLIWGLGADRLGVLLAVATAVQVAHDPGLFPLATQLQGVNNEIVQRIVATEVLPALEQELRSATPLFLGEGVARVLGSICASSTPGRRRAFCNTSGNQMDTVIRHLSGGRLGPARNVLESLVSGADRAHSDGVITDNERALVVGGAGMILQKL